MADIQHQFGNDLTISATGDLATSDATQLGQERLLRRLLTIPKAYIWHVAYGAGLPRFVGEVANKLRIAAVARSQMYREASVARTPAPDIGVDIQPNGVVTLSLKYVDAATGAQQTLSFNANG